MSKPGDNTGHVFVVVADPEILDDGVVVVRAYDSSDVIHYDDTRGKAAIHLPQVSDPERSSSSTAAPAFKFNSVPEIRC